MISIRGEIDRVADENGLSKRASKVCPTHRRRSSRTVGTAIFEELGAYPLPGLRQQKYFAPVARIDGATGDRNLICALSRSRCTPARPEVAFVTPHQQTERVHL